MRVYYSGFDAEGKKFHRVEDVLDVEEIYHAIDKNEEDLIQLIELPAALESLTGGGKKKIKNKEVVEFCQHLVTYIDGGVDLGTIFKDFQREKNSPSMKVLLKKTSLSLSEGESLSAAFKKTESLPDILITLLEIGEKSGNISKSLKDAIVYLEREIDVKSATYRALIYPIFTLTAMLIGLVIWVGFVIPQVVTLIQEMNVELPVQTKMLLTVSNFMQDYWALELLVIVIIMGVLIGGRHFSQSRYYLDKLWWYMPITGKVILSSQMAFYFNYFKVLYDAGVPVLDIINRMQQAIPNHYFRKQIIASNVLIKEGGTLQNGYKEAKVFEPIAIRIIGVGEQSGNIERQLGLLANNYRNRVHVFVQTLPKILEPVFITIIGILFILFVSTILGPLYEVIVRVSGAF